MNKQNKPWYIWLSFLGLTFLWGDTTRHIKVMQGQFELWGRAVWNVIKLFITHLILPIVALGVFGMVWERLFPGTADREPSELASELGMLFVFLLIYLCGVHAAYKHAVWRKKNLPHLFTKNETQQENDNDSKS